MPIVSVFIYTDICELFTTVSHRAKPSISVLQFIPTSLSFSLFLMGRSLLLSLYPFIHSIKEL